MSTGFARARTDEQREQRRESILSAAREMLADHRVGEIGLNELARHVGLAKSNVLRYFQSREAVLLELYERELTEWLDALEQEFAARPADADPVEFVAATVARTVAARPVLCELGSNAMGVLEHNVSGEAAATHKRAVVRQSARLSDLIGGVFPSLGDGGRLAFVASTLLVVSGSWHMARPSAGMAEAYAADPELAALQFELPVAVREFTATILTGLLAREPRL